MKIEQGDRRIACQLTDLLSLENANSGWEFMVGLLSADLKGARPLAGTPLDRIATAEEFANLAGFLASE
jgi:hypothetical protein